MSSILKALKKLEDDKITRRPNELKIDAEILRSDNSPRFSPAAVILGAVLLLAGGSGATYLYMRQYKAPVLVDSRPTVTSRLNTPPVPRVSEIKTEQPSVAEVVVPAKQQKSTEVEALKRHQQQTSDKTLPADAAPKTVQKKVAVKSAGQTQETKTTSPTPPSSSLKIVPALRVNGIAFQDGATDNVAMINEMALTSGAVIDGVKIEAIHKNRVAFSYRGEKFEILLGQSNR